MMTEQDILERNLALIDFVHEYMGENFQVVDKNPNSPYIVKNKSYIISAHIKNYVLVFNSQPKFGDKIGSIHIKKHGMERDQLKRLIANYMNQAVHRMVWTIEYIAGGVTMYYIGHHRYMGKRYPTFSHRTDKFFFDVNHAVEAMEQLVIPTEGQMLIANYPHVNDEGVDEQVLGGVNNLWDACMPKIQGVQSKVIITSTPMGSAYNHFKEIYDEEQK